MTKHDTILQDVLEHFDRTTGTLEKTALGKPYLAIETDHGKADKSRLASPLAHMVSGAWITGGDEYRLPTRNNMGRWLSHGLNNFPFTLFIVACGVAGAASDMRRLLLNLTNGDGEINDDHRKAGHFKSANHLPKWPR